MKAVANIKHICETYMSNNYSLEIIDVHQQPGLAKTEDIIAVPTLTKECTDRVQRLIGDLSDTAKVLRFLDIDPAEAS